MMQASNGVEGQMEERTPIACPFCFENFFTKSTNLPRNKSLVCRTHLNTVACRTKRGAVVEHTANVTDSAVGAGHTATVPVPEHGGVTMDQLPKSRQRGYASRRV